ncbi:MULTISPECIES: hypothetical protein [unclassified Bradyrhizobium]|uniref:hypothetical protein n=1 Tax=unclassified Bradyrhizobium TaxID=2631580 RepID=UPI0028E5C4B1|nr:MULTISPECIES: hypothetical protein [unclassified Bradyrhizobium]
MAAVKLPHGLIDEHGIHSSAISDIDKKKDMVRQALLQTGIDRNELAAVTVLTLLDHVPDSTPSGATVAEPVGPNTAKQLRKTIDRSVQLNLAATAIVGAAL